MMLMCDECLSFAFLINTNAEEEVSLPFCIYGEIIPSG